MAHFASIILRDPVTRGACDGNTRWDMIHDPFSLPSKLQSALYYYSPVSLLFIGLAYASFGSSMRAGHPEIGVSWIKKRKAKPAEPSPSTFCFSLKLYTPSFAFRSSRPSRQRKAPLLPSPLSLSRPSRVAAKAISGDSWEDYCGAARRERQSRPPKST